MSIKKEKVAMQYRAFPDEISTIPVKQIHLMRKLVNHQFSDLSKDIYFDFVDDKPYSYTSVKEMADDYTNKNVIKVNTTGNGSTLWGAFYNLQFRAVHDFIHAYYGIDFNYEGEIEAFHKQYEMSKKSFKEFFELDWRLYHAILRSEIIYQAAVKEYYGEFDINDQKIILKEFTFV